VILAVGLLVLAGRSYMLEKFVFTL